MPRTIGEYEILGEVGRGGMGVVFRGRTREGVETAIKLLAKESQIAHERFEREQRLLAALSVEDGFVPILDAGKTAEGHPFFVMPFVAGGTLRALLELKGKLAVDTTVELGKTLARALGRAHERGIVHRDLKPENILFTSDGQPLISDLGLAKHFKRTGPGATGTVSLSLDGGLMGTPGYMPYEQLADARSVEPPGDVFALGVILYECLGGRRPFEGDTVVELVTRIGEGKFPPIERVRADVPDWLASVIARALARHANQRYADGAALARALENRASARLTPREVTNLRLAPTLADGATIAGAGALELKPEAPGTISRDETRFLPAPAVPPTATPTSAAPRSRKLLASLPVPASVQHLALGAAIAAGLHVATCGLFARIVSGIVHELFGHLVLGLVLGRVSAPALVRTEIAEVTTPLIIIVWAAIFGGTLAAFARSRSNARWVLTALTVAYPVIALTKLNDVVSLAGPHLTEVALGSLFLLVAAWGGIFERDEQRPALATFGWTLCGVNVALFAQLASSGQARAAYMTAETADKDLETLSETLRCQLASTSGVLLVFSVALAVAACALGIVLARRDTSD